MCAQARVNPYSAELSEGFKTAFVDLPSSEEIDGDARDAYLAFIDNFGTHYVEEADFGARATVMSKFDKASSERLKSQGVDVVQAAGSSLKAQAAGFYKGFVVSGSHEHSDSGGSATTNDASQAQLFEEDASSVKKTFTGKSGILDANGKVQV